MTSAGYSSRVTSHLAESFLSYVIIFFIWQLVFFFKWVERKAEAILLSVPVLTDMVQEKKRVTAI